MGTNHVLISAIVSLLFVALMIRFLKMRILSEKLAIFWIVVGAGCFFITVCFRRVEEIAVALGFQDPNNILILSAILFVICLCLVISAKISKFGEQIKILAQDNAILKLEMMQMKESTNND